MPLYEYLCNDCDTRFDALVQSRDQANMLLCHNCSSGNTRRLVSTFARLGGGFDDHADLLSGNSNAGGCCGGSCGCSHA